MLNSKGELVKFPQELAIIHELFHAIAGDVDPSGSGPVNGNVTDSDLNDPTFDDVGAAARDTNIVAAQMGLTDYLLPSYLTGIADSDPRFAWLDAGIDYSDGRDVSVARFGDLPLSSSIVLGATDTTDVIDMSKRTTQGVYVAFGFDGVDKIYGGAGDNFLYGGQDNDTLVGGSGNNLLHGGDRTKPTAGDGADTADYSGDLGLSGRHGVSISIDPNLVTSADKVDDVTPIIVTDNGFGGRDRLVSIETIKLTDQADTVLIGAGSDELLKGLKEIDAGGNGTGEKDILDFSKFDGTLTIADGKLIGTDISILIKNFEQVIGSSAGDTFNFAGSSVTKVEGGSGDDVITAGDAYAILLGGDGNDTLIAGSAGSVLDGGQSSGYISDGGGNHYVGGAGADTFVIGNGADAKNGSDADFIISNASAADRLVLRLDDTLGFADAGNWTKGIVLNGGVETIGQGGVDPDQVFADFSSVLVKPQAIETNSDGAWITETGLENVRPELGYFQVSYQWYKPESELFVFVQSAYGRFSVRVDGFENGELGLNFTDVSEPKLEAYHGSQSTVEIIDSWTPYHNAVQSLIQSTQIVDLPSPGEPIDGNVSPVTPYADIYWVPYPLHP